MSESKITISSSNSLNITQTYTSANTPATIESGTKITASNKIETKERVTYMAPVTELKAGVQAE